MSFKSGVKRLRSYRWWEWRQGLWWGDKCKMRWSRKRVREWTGWGWRNKEGGMVMNIGERLVFVTTTTIQVVEQGW